jgi:hypothetical protein
MGHRRVRPPQRGGDGGNSACRRKGLRGPRPRLGRDRHPGHGPPGSPGRSERGALRGHKHRPDVPHGGRPRGRGRRPGGGDPHGSGRTLWWWANPFRPCSPRPLPRRDFPGTGPSWWETRPRWTSWGHRAGVSAILMGDAPLSGEGDFRCPDGRISSLPDLFSPERTCGRWSLPRTE